MKTTVSLFVAAALLIVLRVVWAIADPIHFDTVKTLIYARDVVCLGPAVVLAFVGLVRSRWGIPLGRVTSSKAIGAAAVFAAIACGIVAHFVLLGVPSIVDEAAYVWQGQLIADGHLSSAVPTQDAATLVQYVGDLSDRRVSVFFPGSSVPLALGSLIGAEELVNPVLAGLLVLVCGWSARRLFDRRTAVIATVLLATSPFLIFQGASYFGQIWTALLTIPAFTIAVSMRRRFDPLLVGVLLTGAMFSRPLSAAIAGAVIAGFWVARERKSSIRPLFMAGLGALPLALLFLAMNASLTGNALETVHTALLPDDKPVLGVNTLRNIVLNSAGMIVDATGLVLAVAGLFLAALWKKRSDPTFVAIGTYVAAQTVVYAAYYNHGISYGPRFLFEVAPLCVMVVAVGLQDVVAGTGVRGKAVDGRIAAVVGLAIVVSLAGVMPERVVLFHARAQYLSLDRVEEEIGAARAVVLIEPGAYRFPDPFYEAFVKNGPDPASNDILYLRADAIGPCEAADAHPGRQVFTYDPIDSSASGPAASAPGLRLATCPFP